MNRKMIRSLTLVALAVSAVGLTACKQGQTTEPAPTAAKSSSGGWGAGPYTEWKPITPPSQTGK